MNRITCPVETPDHLARRPQGRETLSRREILVALSCVLCIVAAAPAETFTVNSVIDATDVNPGDGICETAVGTDECSLRAAVQEANVWPGADTVSIPAGTYALTIAGDEEDEAATGDLDVNDELSIQGAGAVTTIIDAGGIDRIFDLPIFVGASAAEIVDLTLENGDANGGAIRMFEGALTVTRCVLRNNVAFSSGGAILASHGTIVVLDSTISGNQAGLTGGGLHSGAGTTEVTGSTITGNTSGNTGGGIYLSSGSLTITDSTISNNTAVWGAGMAVFSEATIARTTIVSNAAFDQGGGIRLFGDGTITNSTFSANSARLGGAIELRLGMLDIINTTIHENNSSVAASLYLEFLAGDPTASLQNSIVANDLGTTNCNGGLTSLGGNLDSGTNCGFTDPGDLSSVDPMLESLADNGGPTMTHALLPGSPGIDFASCELETDQRGGLRPASGCDSGAFELGGLLPQVFADGFETGDASAWFPAS